MQLFEETFITTLARWVDDNGGFISAYGDIFENRFSRARDEATIGQTIECGILGGLTGSIGADFDTIDGVETLRARNREQS